MPAIDDFLHEYGAALAEAARLGVEAEHAEHLRRNALADAMGENDGLPEWKADARARATNTYLDALTRWKDAALAAAEAKAKAEHLRARLDVWRTRMSTERERIRQTGGSSW